MAPNNLLVCAACNEERVGDFIDCDTCKKYFHQACQDVVLAVGQKMDWSCKECVKARKSFNRSSHNNSTEDVVLIGMKRQRDMVINQIKSHKDYVMQFDSQIHNIENLEARLEMMEEIYSEFKKIQDEIQQYVQDETGDEVKEAADAYTAFSNEYCMVKGFMKKRIAQSQTNKRPNTNYNASELTKLPPIQMPEFSGDVKEWVTFRDTFNALVISQNIPGVTKLHYLRAAVKNGDAWKLISEIQQSDDTFEVAWHTLEKRYNNRNVIIDSHVTELFKLRSISTESATEIWKLVEGCGKHLKALETLGEPVGHWDTLIVHMIKFRLDEASKRIWETTTVSQAERPTWKQLELFLMDRGRVLEALESNKKKASGFKPKVKFEKKTTAFLGSSSKDEKPKCGYCNEAHKIDNCSKFLSLDVSKRCDALRAKGLCFRCLQRGHLSANCQVNCECCQGRHNKLIHLDRTQKNEEPEKKTSSNLGSTGVCSQILLMTAKVRVKSRTGEWIQAKALLDGGSQSNFCTERFAERLKLQPKSTNISVKGIVGEVEQVCKRIKTDIASNHTEFLRSAEFLLIKEIIEKSPAVKVNMSSARIPTEVRARLADDSFTDPAEVDLLLGVDLFLESLLMERMEIVGSFPIFQNTRFGWVVGGKCNSPCNPKVVTTALVSTIDLDHELKRFWELEDLGTEKRVTREEAECEAHFVKTYRRKSNGKYEVKLPLKVDPHEALGDSKVIALKRFASTEKRLSKDKDLKEQYIKFMREYQSLGHMKKVKEPEAGEGYIMPHHPVLKPDSSTTKLRVVFNLSEETSNGVSMNDLVVVGAMPQDNLFVIVIRSRKHLVFLTADVEKMYRMIDSNEEDLKFQMIVWREEPVDPIEFFELQTVTYGGAAAAQLSTRVLEQLAKDEGKRFPLAAKAIRDFSMDDFVGGATTVSDALKLQRQLIDMFKTAGMRLRKWCSNKPELLTHLPREEVEVNLLEGSNLNETIKTLGLVWYPDTDQYGFKIGEINLKKQLTKREMLSQILKLFDPVGFLSPVIAVGRLLMQELWLLKCSWDEKLPSDIQDSWNRYSEDLAIVSQIRIKRCVMHSEKPKLIELHGFADASEKAYGACCYIRTVEESGEVNVELLCSKFRVAPLKKRTLPELELCAAVLLCRLIKNVVRAMQMEFNSVVLWTDSTIVLSWIQIPSHRLQTFVGNRVSEIQELNTKYRWLHVTSKSNPADLLSRGMSPTELQHSTLWWNGPPYLLKSIEFWPKQPRCLNLQNLPALKPEKFNVMLVTTKVTDLMERYSSLTKFVRYIAYWLRYIRNKFKKNLFKRSGFLAQAELRESLKAIVRWDQRQHFPKEYKQLAGGNQIDSNSKIKSLNPFMDDEKLIRVGGRLKASKLNFDGRHQMLLARESDVTKKLIVETHDDMGHVGCQALLSIIRQRFWPIHGKQIIRILVRQCVVCAKMKPLSVEQFMGDLPIERVEFIYPFYATGIDYAGPFMVKEGGVRSKKFFKCWIAVFICMTTSAIHLELVQDLTSKSFIQALTRFVSRRGRPGVIMSDNSTTFTGANNLLKEIGELVTSEAHNEEVDRFCAGLGIQWKFIPPRSPHMGGKWEAAVKSFKFHFYRIVGLANLTVIEIQTVLCKVEAILNSRPLLPESSDANDLNAITPGHFLIGRPLVSIPEIDVTEVNIERLARFERVQQASQHFGQRFHDEYLNSLQNRAKAYKKSIEFSVGQLVVLKDENLKPLHWNMARIVDVHPGKDGIVRVVTVKTKSGIYQRAVNKICPLPVEPETFQEGEYVESQP